MNRRSSVIPFLASAWMVVFPSKFAPQEYKTIRTIEIVGNTYFPQSMLLDCLRMTRLNAPVVPGMVEYDVEANLKSFLKEHGFLQSEVEWRLVPLEGRDVALHVQIKEGPQYRLADLTVKGITAFATEDISSQFDLRVGDVLNLVEVKNALQKIMAMYADQGFIECSYIPDMDLDPVKRTAAISFTFQEGTRYRVGYVGFVGCDDQAEEDRLRAQVDIHPGEIFSPTKQKSVLVLLKRFGVIDSTVENVDEKRGLVGIVFWLQKPQ